MKKVLAITVFVAMLAVVFTSCNGSRKSQCACPSKKGLIGY